MIYNKGVFIKDENDIIITPTKELGHIASSTTFLDSINTKVATQATLASATTVLSSIYTNQTNATQITKLGNASGTVFNPSKEDGNLNTIRLQTDKLQFNADGTLKVATTAPDAGNVFATNFTLTLGSAEVSAVYISNPTGSGKTLYLISIQYDLYASTTQRCFFKMFKTPTVSANGTAVTLSNQSNGNTTTSLMNIYSLPTTTADGTLWGPTGSANSTVANAPVNVADMSIKPGYTALIKAQADGTNRLVYIRILYKEL